MRARRRPTLGSASNDCGQGLSRNEAGPLLAVRGLASGSSPSAARGYFHPRTLELGQAQLVELEAPAASEL